MDEEPGTSPLPDPEELSELYAAALELAPGERAAFLDRACSGRDSLRAELESLLEAHRLAPAFLESRPAAVLLGASPAELPAGKRVGPYRLLRELGRGGMGTVYLAERADGAFEQQVALKLIQGGFGAEPVRDRFLRERQILARLEHPNIARLLDGGVSEEGAPYFAMEVVLGARVTEHCDARRLSIVERLQLFDQACSAVQHAHGHLVVHRDLKPSNMLVAEDGRLKLLDFGIAKLLSEEGDEPALTRGGLQPLTPEYAAPEQLRGEAATTATDVYSLGVVLYELVTGRRPFSAAASAGRPGAEREPEPPSTVLLRRPAASRRAAEPSLEELAAARSTTPQRLRRAVAGDLEAILLQALQPDADRRYASVEGLAEDLRRFRSGQPVRARPATLRYRAGKLLRRHRVAFAAATVALASLLAGLSASLWQARVAAHERARAEAAAAEAEEVADYFVDLFRNVDPEHAAGGAVTARELLDRGALRLRSTLAERPLTRARLQQAMAGVYHHLRLLEPAAELLQDAVALREREQGAEHPALVAPLCELGFVYYRATRYDDARRALERAMRIAESAHLERTAEYTRVLVLLGNLRLAERSWPAAEEAFRHALAVLQQGPGGAALDETAILNNLGVALHFQGRHREAEAVHRQALAIRERAQGPDHFSVAQSLVNLALIAIARGDTAAASPLVERALAIRERTYGHEHPMVAEALALRAGVAAGQGRPAEELDAWREALRIREATLGVAHPESAATALRLAQLLARLDRLGEAERLAGSALTRLAASGGADPADVLRARATVAELRLRRGDPVGAVAVMKPPRAGDAGPRAAAPAAAAVADEFAAQLEAQGLAEEAARIRSAKRTSPRR